MTDAARIAEDLLELPAGSLKPSEHGNTKVKTVRERAKRSED